MTEGAVATPVFINCRDRVTPLRALVSWLERAGHERIVLVDNASTYPPLLEFYDQTPHEVVKLGANLGPQAVWTARLTDFFPNCRYVLTDSDVVPDDDAPVDAVDRFGDLLDRYEDVDKVGFGLRIDDLPSEYGFRADVIDWESQFWEDEIEPGVFRADLDTTFALYRSHVRTRTFTALRTGFPYVARHISWYIDSSNLSDEEAYYRHHARKDWTNWSSDALPSELLAAIEHHRSRRANAQHQP
jgi:hypothetical protein